MPQHLGTSDDPEVIVFNLKKRYTGVSATVNALVPLQLADPGGHAGEPVLVRRCGLEPRRAVVIQPGQPVGQLGGKRLPQQGELFELVVAHVVPPHHRCRDCGLQTA